MFNSLFKNQVLFEWQFFTRQPSFFIITLIFFSLALLLPSLTLPILGNVNHNGAYATAFMTTLFIVFSLILVVNFIANTALRNHETNMAEVIFCKPIHPCSYQLGRFLGSFIVVIVIFSLVPIGLALGSFMPWVDPTTMGSFNANFYLLPFLYLAVPTLFIFSCIFYTLAIRFKSIKVVYIAAVILMLLNEMAGNLLLSTDASYFGVLLDPFSTELFMEITKYWTVAERNNQELTFSGNLMYNRLLWMLISIVILVGFGQLNATLAIRNDFVKAKKQKKSDKKQAKELLQADDFLANKIRFSGVKNAYFKQFITRTSFEVKQVLFDAGFYILSGSILLFMMVMMITEPQGMFGNSLWPLTQIMVETSSKALTFLSLVIITYYSAEIIWREKSTNIGDIVDSLPVNNAIFWLSKLLAMFAVLFLLVLFTVVLTICYQLSQGYQNIDLMQYFVSMVYFTLLPWLMMSVVAFFCQALSPNKFTGMLLFVLFIVAEFTLDPLGFNHNLFHFSHSPSWFYSDMNLYGQALEVHTWYMLYWGGFTIALAVLTYGLWQRGPQQSLKVRAKLLGYQIGRPGLLTIAAALFISLGSGVNIYHNTYVQNHFVSQSELKDIHANYEKSYRQFANDAVPAMSKINAKVDIYPSEHKIEISADIVFTNHTAQPIKKFLVAITGYSRILNMGQGLGFSPVDFTLEIAGGKMGAVDGELNTHWFEFEQAMLPNESRKGTFTSIRDQDGFVETVPSLQVINNGSFVQNGEIFPRFGYLKSEQLLSNKDRSSYGLEKLGGTNKLEDTRYYNQPMSGTLYGISGGSIEFETTVSTSANQTAIAPGYLTKAWLVGNRRYFHYKMDRPIQNYFAYFSGEYEIARSHHKGIDIEVYYHKEHQMNIQRIETSMKDSLDYYTENFGPFQHKQARIIEFASKLSLAQDFPNTIAYSERMGFIHDLSKPADNDQVYLVAAHEMAHQWWGSQIDPANVQGATFIIETLAQYSSFMLIQKKYGKERLAAMLQFELNRYLKGRSRETVKELPLMREENQAYIHYSKGAIAMMALADRLGEKRLNSALQKFLLKYKFNQDKFPTTLDLMDFIKEGANVEELAFITRVFYEINIYDLRLLSANTEPLANGQYKVTLNIDANRSQMDSNTVEQNVELNELVDIALWLKSSKRNMHMSKRTSRQPPAYLQKHAIKTGHNVIEIIMNEEPAKAMLDPYIHFVDRNINNNSANF